jgi:hypothetical protein
MASNSKKASPTRSSPVKGAKIEKPPPVKKGPARNKDGSLHKSPTTIFGPDAVTRYLSIPQTGNITCVELVVFLPELLRTPGVLYRFFQNNANARTLDRIVKWFRVAVKNHTPETGTNAMRHLIQGALRYYFQDEDWTERRHKAGLYKQAGEVWDHDNLTFAGVKNYCENGRPTGRHHRVPVDNVRFASLAAHVIVFPSGNDELDLTRCVKAAVANEDLPLMFPRDFDYLTQLLGGPRTVTNAHRDAARFDDWISVHWDQAASPLHVQAATDVTRHVFTAEQRAAIEQHLLWFVSVQQIEPVQQSDPVQQDVSAQPLAPAEKPVLAEPRGPADVPAHMSFYQPQSPPETSTISPSSSQLLSRIMNHTAPELMLALAGLPADQMDALYTNCLAAHNIVSSTSREEYTSDSNNLPSSTLFDRSLQGPVFPAAHSAVVLSPSPLWTSDAFAHDNAWQGLDPVGWLEDEGSASGAPLDLSEFDPAILESSDFDLAGFINPDYNTEPYQVDPGAYDTDTLDAIEDPFAGRNT